MVAEREYDFHMRRLNAAWGTGFAGMIVALVLGATASAQINGVPASVTSIGFGGQGNRTPGVPASVTSLGPNGFQPRNPFFNQPTCCINPLFPLSPNPPVSSGHHHHGSGLPSGGVVYSIPNAPVIVEQPVVAEEQADEDEYNGGPTIFDRRGPGSERFADGRRDEGRINDEGRLSEGRINGDRINDDRRDPARYSQRSQESVALAEPAPVPSQPQTLLVFKDGHQVEVENYAIVGDTLFDLSDGRRKRVALAELDLAATAKQNDDRGVDFAVPAGFETN